MLEIGMAELLPAIDIAVPIEPSLFLEQMAEIGRNSGHFDVNHVHENVAGPDLEVVNFRFIEDSPHEEPGFQLIARGEMPKRVAVEARASRWLPDPPTRQAYCEAARLFAGGLLTTYNKTYNTRLRLRIAKVGRDGFKMTVRTATLLHRFTVLANTSSLHPLDWNRFYAFAREVRQEIPGHVLQAELEAHGFSPEKAEYLRYIFHHLKAYKRLQ